MMLEDVLKDLRSVAKGERLLHREVASRAVEAIEMLVDRVKYLEELSK